MNTPKTFQQKLWLWFVLFSAAIFAVLWLLQTVFLQSFYDSMSIRSAEKAADEMAAHASDSNFTDILTETAVSHSLLVFLTDSQGSILYSADEYQHLYRSTEESGGHGADNPYRGDSVMNWEKGSLRNLPYSYGDLVSRLKASGEDRIGFTTEDGTAYVTGILLDNGNLLSVSMPLGTVGRTVDILRIQLAWVSLLSLALGFLLAWGISRRFSAPITQIAGAAQDIAAGKYHPGLPKGFCAELDHLSDTLQDTALRLEKAQNAQRELLANVSHDLRTPLTMIKGYAELVKDISWSDEQQREQDLDIIMREADRLTALVNEILEFSAMQQTNGAAPEQFPMDLSRAVSDVVQQFLPICQQNGIGLQADLAPHLVVSANEAQIKRVVYNFIDNAINHTGDSKRVSVTLTQTQGRARLAVSDYGQGISPEDLPYVWDRYYTSRSRKNKAVVSGLGLSIAREILTAHKASYGADSQDCCTFWFELPCS